MTSTAAAAIPTTFLAARRQRQRGRALTMLGLIFVSYAVDTLTIGLFVLAGSVQRDVLLTYGLAAALVNVVFFAAFWSGYSLRFKDPNLTREQMVFAVGIQLLCLWVEPTLAFLFLNVLFIIFGFGTLRLSLREAVIAVTVAIGGIALVIGHQWRDMMPPHTTPHEVALVILCYSSALLRCMCIGLYGGAMRLQLHKKNKQLAEFSEQISRLANYDDLTGIFNRRSMWLMIEEQTQLERLPPDDLIYVALLDLDNFKSINDRFGHGIGDEVLRLFAAQVSSLLRKGDVFGRYGGEEFLLLLAATSAEQAVTILERIRCAVEKRSWHELASELSVTVSIGVAAFNSKESIRELISRADLALYEAKRGGRNKLAVAREPAQ